MDDTLTDKDAPVDTAPAKESATRTVRGPLNFVGSSRAQSRNLADAADADDADDASSADEEEELSAEELLEITPVSVPEKVISVEEEEEHDDPLSEVYVLEEALPPPKRDTRSKYKVASAKEFFNTEVLYRYDLLEEAEKETIKGRYRIELKGFQGGIWTVEVGNELTVANRSEEADVVISMQQKDFLDLINGGLNPQLAMLSQKIKIIGDVKKAVFFQSVLAPLFD